MKVIDLFAGCGGFSTGFIQAGYEILKAVEFDSSIANTYQINHPTTKTIVADIGTVDNCDYFSEGEADVIIGGPPCQGFSMAGARIRGGFIDDPRNYLFKHYFNVVKIVKPQVFIIENVKGILTMSKGAIFNEIVSLFSDKDNFDGDKYYVHHKIVNGLDFGIPQHRERVVIIGVKNHDFDIDSLFKQTNKKIAEIYPDFFNKVTVWDAISNIPNPTTNGECCARLAESGYQRYLSNNIQMLYNNTATSHSDIAIKRMQHIKQGDNWTCLDEEIHSVHSGAYGRLEKEGFSPTITTRFDTPSGGKFIHPIENRTLTPREAARIQSFPDTFIFYGKKSSICKQIGNAVPPKIAYFLAELTRSILDEICK
ncbi:MAG: DNA cytosine methyltransferase [Christensenellales bacterium]